MINLMRILVRLVINWKILEIFSRFCVTLSAIGCMYIYHTDWREWGECHICECIYLWIYVCSILHHTAAHCSIHISQIFTYKYLYIYIYIYITDWGGRSTCHICECIHMYIYISHCNTLQHTATHRSTCITHVFVCTNI